MRALVDGENLRHQIAGVLYAHKKIKDKNAYFAFDLVGFCKDVLRIDELEVIYYTTKIKQPFQKIPIKLANNISAISAANRQWIARLTNQGVVVVKAGHLRVRESSSCVHCGRKTLVLQEKGVDVQIATDIVLAAHKKIGNIVLASSDSDLVPALTTAKSLGAKINYMCYTAQLNHSVAALAAKVITFDGIAVLKYFGK